MGNYLKVFSVVWAVDNKHGQFLFASARDESINKNTECSFVPSHTLWNRKFKPIISMELNSLRKQSSYLF